jgi:predicted nucleotidyltransferase
MKDKEVCDKIKEVLSKEPEVLAIFDNGSSIVGMDTPESDVDFVIIVQKKSQITKLIKILTEKTSLIEVEKGGGKAKCASFLVYNKRADISFVIKSMLDSIVNTFYDKKENYLENQHFLKHKIIDSVAVYDPKNLLESYKKKVEKYPQKFLNEIFNDSIKSIKENLYYWKHHGFRNEFQFGFEQWEVIQQICQALYAKNKRLFMLPYKRLHKDLKELKPDIEKEMYALIRGKNTNQMIKKKIEIVKSIASKLEKKELK